MPVAVVESGDGSSSTWLGTARSLGRHRVPVLRLSPRSWYASKYCTTHISPNVHTDPQRYLAFLLALGRRLRQRREEKPVLFPSSDDGLSVIAQNLEALQHDFTPVASGWPVIRLLVDKLNTYQQAHALQIPIPHTLAPQTITDVQRMRHEITYPCLLKPRMSHQFWPHFRVKLFRIHSPAELLRQYQAYPTIPWLIQEEIPGPADRIVTLRACLNRDAQPIGFHVTQKLRQWPPDFGIGSYAQSVWDPRVVTLGLRILQHLGFYGIASVEFKRDDRTNTLNLIEINGRSGTMTYLSTLCGVNTPYLAYQEARGIHPPVVDPTQCPYEVGPTWIHLQLDALSLTQQSATNALTWLEWLRTLLHRPHCFAIFAWNDLRPFLSEIRRILTHNVRSTRTNPPSTPRIRQDREVPKVGA